MALGPEDGESQHPGLPSQTQFIEGRAAGAAPGQSPAGKQGFQGEQGTLRRELWLGSLAVPSSPYHCWPVTTETSPALSPAQRQDCPPPSPWTSLGMLSAHGRRV